MTGAGVRIIAVAALFAAAVPFAAASEPESADSGKGEQQSMQQQWSETLETLKSYSAEQRDKALAAGKKTLDAMDERIDRLESWTTEHWDSLSEKSREKKTELLHSMREQRKKVAEWYGGMKHSSSEAWESVKEGFISSYDKLQSTYRDAVDSIGSEDQDGGEPGGEESN